MEREIHFYESCKVYPDDCEILHDYDSVKKAIEEYKLPQVHTTQMCMLGNSYMHEVNGGYRLFVHKGNGEVYEITLKSKGGTGQRAVRDHQNIFGMWKSGALEK